MKLSDYHPSMEGATPVTPTQPVLQNAQPQIPNEQTQVSAYLRTTVPLPLQYAPDTLKQYNRPGLSSYRTSPISPSGIPGINAAVSSTTTTNINEFATVAAIGPNGAIQFANGGALDGVSQFEWLNGISTLAITGTIQLVGTANATVFNASTGFQIGGTAVSGNILVGNGTAFVSGTGAGLALWNTVTKTANYIAVAGDYVECNTSGGGFTVTLPSAAANTNRSIRVKKISSDSNTLTIAAADNIDGNSSFLVTFQNTEGEFTATSSTWLVG